MAESDKSPQPARRAGQRQRAGRRGRQGSSAPGTATVELPFVTAEFRMPELRIPELRMPDVTQLPVPGLSNDDLDGAVRFVRAYLPPPHQAAYYACLGVLGALQLVEWPVVLAIGAGTAISRQAGDRDAASEGSGTGGGSGSRAH